MEEHRLLAAMDPPTRRIYGRDADFALLERALCMAREGSRQLVLVGGESGIGKTSLVETFATIARDGGARVLLGRCYDLAMTPPYGAWVDLLRTHVPETGSSLPRLQARADDEAQPTQEEVFAEVGSFLHQLADSGPLLVILEDQHWSDTASLELLRYLLRATRHTPVLYIITYRDAELTPQYPLYRYLPLLVRESQPVRVELRRLSVESMRELVLDRYGLKDPDTERLVAYLAEYAQGNPFFIEELMRALEHERILEARDGVWRLGDLLALQLPPLVRQVIDARVAWLDDDARHALEIAAVIGSEIPFDVWRSTLGVGEEELAEPIEQALQAGLIVERADGTGFRFSHNLVRETLYHSLLPPRRQRWHRRIAEVLSGQPAADSGVVAAHFQSARDQRAVEWLIRAGDEAVQVSALQSAAERYEQALYLLQDERSQRRGWLLCALAHTYRYSEPERSLHYLDEARQLLDATDDRALSTAVLWNRARIRGFLGDNTLEDLNETISAYEQMTRSDRERVLQLGRRFGGIQGPFAQWLGHHGRYREAIDIALKCIEELDATASLPRGQERGHALLGKALGEAATGDADGAERSFQAAFEHFADTRHHFMAAASLKWELLECLLPYRADDPLRLGEAVEEYRQHWRTGRHCRFDAGEPLLPIFPHLFLRGEWDRMERAARAYLDITFLRTDGLAALAELAYWRGNAGDAWAAVRKALPGGPDTDPGTPFFVRTLAVQRIAAALAIDDGDLQSAARWLDMHDRWIEWSGRRLDRAVAMTMRSQLADKSGDQGEALRMARAALEEASAPWQPLALVAAHRQIGYLLIRSSDHDKAEAHLDEAERIAVACEAPLELALVQASQAALAAERRGRAGANALVQVAAETATRLGASHLLDLLPRWSEDRPDRKATGTGSSPLTAREHEVLQLLASGLTDAEIGEQLFISPRTVGRHLQSIYGKFGVTSRTAAVTYAFEHGLLDQPSAG